MEKFQNFENWLKANHHLSWRESIISMNAIDKILMVPNLENISSVSILNQLLSALRKNAAFAAKAKTQTDKEIKIFKMFIQFKEEEKAGKEPAAQQAS